eukprot:7920794-Ditylum_brightwellii.AAC.1
MESKEHVPIFVLFSTDATKVNFSFHMNDINITVVVIPVQTGSAVIVEQGRGLDIMEMKVRAHITKMH